MDHYVPPGYRSLIDHIEAVAIELRPGLPRADAGADAIKSELQAAYAAYRLRNSGNPSKHETFLEFAGPFAEGIMIPSMDWLSSGCKPSQVQRYHLAVEAVKARLADQRKQPLADARKRVRDALWSSGLTAYRADLEPIPTKYWASPAGAKTIETGTIDGDQALVEHKDEDIGRPADGGRLQFRRFLEQQCLQPGAVLHGKAHYFQAFEQSVGYTPSETGMKEVWRDFSAANPYLKLSQPGRPPVLKSGG